MSRMSNYPNGFKDGITIRGVPLAVTHPGKVFFVNSTSVLAATDDGVAGADTPPSGTYQRPFASIDYANGQCTANRGDIIFVMPGHTETLSSATALAMGVAGVAVVGLGTGSLRPNITLDTADTTTIPVSAANVTVDNVIFTAGFADIASCFTVTASNFVRSRCEFVDSAADLNFLTIATTSTTDNQEDDLQSYDCKWVTPDLLTSTYDTIAGDLDGYVFEDSYLNLGVNTSDLPAVAIVATGKDLTNLRVVGNDVIRLNDANPLLMTMDTTTANTGIVADNKVRHLDVAAELLVTAGTNIGFFDNKATAAIDASGYLIPAADS